jgi:predicted anti-sigma-YlaC factor YlaD
MKCVDAIAFLSPYIDSELDPTTTFQIQAHLHQCDSCRKRFDQENELEQRIAGALKLPMGPAHDAMWNRVIAHALPPSEDNHHQESNRRWRMPLGFRWLMLIASIFILSSAGLGLGYRIQWYSLHSHQGDNDMASTASSFPL